MTAWRSVATARKNIYFDWRGKHFFREKEKWSNVQRRKYMKIGYIYCGLIACTIGLLVDNVYRINTTRHSTMQFDCILSTQCECLACICVVRIYFDHFEIVLCFVMRTRCWARLHAYIHVRLATRQRHFIWSFNRFPLIYFLFWCVISCCVRSLCQHGNFERNNNQPTKTNRKFKRKKWVYSSSTKKDNNKNQITETWSTKRQRRKKHLHPFNWRLSVKNCSHAEYVSMCIWHRNN